MAVSSFSSSFSPDPFAFSLFFLLILFLPPLSDGISVRRCQFLLTEVLNGKTKTKTRHRRHTHTLARWHDRVTGDKIVLQVLEVKTLNGRTRRAHTRVCSRPVHARPRTRTHAPRTLTRTHARTHAHIHTHTPRTYMTYLSFLFFLLFPSRDNQIASQYETLR